jgi:hypothetical protein
MPPETHFFSDFAWDLVHRRAFPIGGAELREEISGFLELENARGLELDTEGLVDDLGGACAGAYDLFDAIVRQLCGPASIWGEKTPGHLWWWPAIAKAAPWMRFVVAVRDPRAVVASTLSMPWVGGFDTDSWGDRLHLAVATRWVFDQEVASSLVATLGPTRSLVVRYEDVVSDPDHARRQIAALLGEHDASFQEAPSTLVHPWEPWKKRALEQVTDDRAGSWIRDLGERRANEVVGICRSKMAELGYPTRRAGRLRSAVRHVTQAQQTRAELAKLMADYRRFESRIADLEL